MDIMYKIVTYYLRLQDMEDEQVLFGQNPDETEMTLFRNEVPADHWI